MANGPTALKNFYRRAVARLSREEQERERSRGIPYAFSLHALSRFFFETGRRQGWLDEKGDGKGPIVLAVSGGSDSTALLWMFRTFYEGKLIAAHVEHGIRGEESLADAKFVEEMARGWGLETEVVHAAVPGLLRRGESLETGARRLRFAFLESLARERGAAGVALGHNKEDGAETVLFNLLRGTGVRGVAGIPERRGIFFRPLLRCSRNFLRGVLRCRGIPWREDRSNGESDYTRNFIRNELMPLVEARINQRAIDHLVAFSEEMRYYREEEERRGGVLLESAQTGGQGVLLSVDRKKARTFSLWERTVLVREIGRRLEIPPLARERCFILARLLGEEKSFEFQWGLGISVFGSRDRADWTEPKKSKV